TQGQLSALGGVLQALPTVSGPSLANPTFRQVDATFGYPIRLGKYSHLLGESALLEPRIAFYNVGNFANFGGNSGNPGVAPYAGDLGSTPQPGNINGPTGTDVINPYRVTRQAGTFDQGAPRTTEYQLRLTF
ncbi:MAG: TonB-dependent receptor, partial [Rhodospirillales bacterium]|nr:TonB-dependent receptor [Acetobacter sp.]